MSDTEKTVISDPNRTVAWEDNSRKSPTVPPASPIPDVTLERELGRGGMGVVYQGRQTYLDRVVAVKLLLVSGAEGREFVQRFQREAKILASLAHPHIVGCYQAGVTAANSPYLVMEFIDGPTLKDWILQHGRMPVAAALGVIRDLARALDHAHESGIIHRDVKPENVLLARKPNPAADDAFPFTTKLVDLGLARPTAGSGDMNLTRQGAVLGTPATMAPEQFDDPDHVDYRADIYGLGCVLFHALTGRPAFTGTTLAAIVTAKISGEIPDATQLKADVPLAVNELVGALLAKDRDQRPQSYAAIVERCERLIGGDPQQLGRQGGRAAWIGVAMAVVVLGGAAWIFTRGQGGERSTEQPRTAAPVAPAPALVANRVPLESLRDSDWGEARGLWAFDIAQRLKQWTFTPGAQWSSAETREDAVAGIAGRITRPLDHLPCRIQGAIHHTSAGGAQSDKAQIGLLLTDGGRIDLTVFNLGAITQTQIQAYKAGDETPYAAQGPVTLPTSKAVPFILVIRADGFLASVDGNAFNAVPLSSAPKELYLGAEGQAPVEVSGLHVRQLK